MKLADGREFDPATLPPPDARVNIYDCAFGHALLSADLDEGVTPMFVTCPFDQAQAGSRGYRVTMPQALAALPVQMVWRKATKSELKRERRAGGDHYAMGGLAREWTGADAPPRTPPVMRGL